MSIATKTGDSGETALMYGRRVSKSNPRVDAYGCVDELNAALGLARVTASDQFIAEQIYDIQKELIIVMGELATAPEDLERYLKDGYQLTTVEMVSAALDLARTTCRRAERRVTSLAEVTKNMNAEILRFLNRLSDLCWLLGRYAEKIEQVPK